MRPLAGPAMMLVMAVGFVILRMSSKEESPPRDFLDLEFEGADFEQTGACYSLSTVLIATYPIGGEARTWTSEGDDRWTLLIDDVVRGNGGPVRAFQKLTFEKHENMARLVTVETTKGFDTDLDRNVEWLVRSAHGRRSTPIDRCLEPGAKGYLFTPRR
jgi:hypothetical protein